jgi:hypothetical protein
MVFAIYNFQAELSIQIYFQIGPAHKSAPHSLTQTDLGPSVSHRSRAFPPALCATCQRLASVAPRARRRERRRPHATHPPDGYKMSRNRCRLPFFHSFLLPKGKMESTVAAVQSPVSPLSTTPLVASFRSEDHLILAHLLVQESKPGAAHHEPPVGSCRRLEPLQ